MLVLVLGGTLAVEIVIAALGVGEHGIAPAIALYTTAVVCERRVSIAALVPITIGYFAATLAAAGSNAFFRAIANALLLSPTAQRIFPNCGGCLCADPAFGY